MSRRRLTFGIFPGGVTFGPETGFLIESIDYPLVMERVKRTLDQLHAKGELFLVRCYMHYLGSGKTGSITPLDMKQYASGGRKLDLALCYRTEEGDIEDWVNFIRRAIQDYGPYLGKIQVAEEPNNPDATSGGDGSFPGVCEAIVAGVPAAKEEAQRQGFRIQVGFNAVPSFDPNNSFWNDIAQMSHPDFLKTLDYVGLDFYPDVFRPLPAGLSIREAVSGVLSHFRSVNLTTGRIPADIPIHITENGWPTSDTRTETQQAISIEEVIRTIDQKKEELNITHYEFFDLLDADRTKTAGLQFGLLRDDFTAKPAFEVFQRLVRELGAGTA